MTVSYALFVALLLCVCYGQRCVLPAGDNLREGDVMVSPNGGYFFRLLNNGNAALYLSPHTVDTNRLFQTNTANKGAAGNRILTMQTDGNLVLSSNGSPIWSSNTMNRGAGGYYLQLQDDANLVIYDKNSKAIWASNTVRVWWYS